jgi:hypothetical protein
VGELCVTPDKDKSEKEVDEMCVTSSKNTTEKAVDELCQNPEKDDYAKYTVDKIRQKLGDFNYEPVPTSYYFK